MSESAAPVAASPRWIDTAVGAKMIRKQLKLTFPGQKFSVRIDRYAGGSSTSVGWTDGPTESEVKAITSGFAGGRFDGSIDLAYHANSWWCDKHGTGVAEIFGHSYNAEQVGVGFGNGPVDSRCCALAELVSFSSNYVHTSRAHSPELVAEATALMLADYNETDYDPNHWIHNNYMSTLMWRQAAGMSKYVKPEAKASK